ncbi:MAG TPA: STAS domain-containing protein [Herpetosiphon sp.]|uniref:Anti-sigma-factor antagonist n=1 Tax=Herpetosiphon aurantiacus (strain ATCC 23779 / DSM 785 / 114-95) TaxID=316274 RepID=A9AYT6_HERA2|nr:STAS domain-containing protein [Herpetosiphon sp.]ABX05064.1 anti-sigma-factor antagonist [Herpetosiphon aurantiacus DSM 785]HBW52069.1 STAS domain-containing protein [Herpetosiphon sp.]
MRLSQRFALLSLLLFESVMSILGLLFLAFNDGAPEVLIGLGILPILTLGLAFGAWRNWPWVPIASVVVATAITVLLLIDPAKDIYFSPVLLAPMAVAFVVTDSRTTIVTALVAIVVTWLRADSDTPYLKVDYAICYAFIAGCLWLGRLILEQTQQANTEALDLAQTERGMAQRYAQEAEDRASSLQTQSEEQQRLLATVAALETPIVEVAEQVLLAPIIGYVDDQRAAQLTDRILAAVNQRRANAIILDITSLSNVNAQTAQQLLRLASAIRLLGSSVILSGISPDLATTLVRQRIDLGMVRTAPTPYAALQLAATL